jgi:mannose-6-phosphate isomerase-like protein (cupin superfamily)
MRCSPSIPGLLAAKTGRVNRRGAHAAGAMAASMHRRYGLQASGKPGIAPRGALPRSNAVFRIQEELGDARRNLASRDVPCIDGADNSEAVMKLMFRSVPTILCLMFGAPALAQDQVRVNPTDPQPTCVMCPGTYIPLSEIDGYAQKALAEKLLDQQVRDIDIGKAHIGIGRVHRGKLDKPAPDSVAEHDQISEVYHVISGAGTLVLGPDIVNRQRRPATMRTVVEFNGPGNNGSEVRDGIAYEIKAGDVVVIPAGTGHWFTRIEDHIDYLMVRIDPDKVTPLKSEAQSQDYLSKPAPRGD